jgi:hypothetical protein
MAPHSTAQCVLKGFGYGERKMAVGQIHSLDESLKGTDCWMDGFGLSTVHYLTRP